MPQTTDLEIRIFPSDESAAGYPVEITLGGQQEFPHDYLSTDVLPWTSSGDSAADGQQLLETLLADPALRSAWAETRGQAPQRRIRLRIDSAAAELHALPWGGPVEERPIRALVIISNPDDLDLPLYLTTNYDNFLAAALAAQEKQPSREICRWNEMLDGLPSLFEDDPEYEPTPEAPLVYHLFGNEEEPDAMVMTEDDHLDFLVHVSAEMERIPHYVWAALANSSLMFLGYGLNDWGFRVIMRGLVATRQRRRRIKHIGVQLDPRDVSVLDVEAAKVFLQQYFQNAEINVFSESLEQFMAELREWWEKEAGE